MKTPVRVLVSNCASWVAVISVGPFGRPLVSLNKSPDCPPGAEPPGVALALAGDCFAPDCLAGDFPPAAGFAVEADFCCATPRTVPKQTIAPNKITNFFTDLIVVDLRNQASLETRSDYKSPNVYFRTLFHGEFLN